MRLSYFVLLLHPWHIHTNLDVKVKSHSSMLKAWFWHPSLHWVELYYGSSPTDFNKITTQQEKGPRENKSLGYNPKWCWASIIPINFSGYSAMGNQTIIVFREAQRQKIFSVTFSGVSVSFWYMENYSCIHDWKRTLKDMVQIQYKMVFMLHLGFHKVTVHSKTKGAIQCVEKYGGDSV